MLKRMSILTLLILVAIASESSATLPDAVEERLRTALEAEWGAGDVAWAVEREPKLDDLAAADRWELEIGERPRGTQIVRIEMWKDDRIWRRVPFRVRVMPFAWVPVTSVPLRRGEPMDVSRVQWTRQEVTTVRHEWPESRENIADTPMRVRRNLDPGDILTWQNLEIAPAVERGDPVQLVLRQGAVVIEAAGTAMQDGHPGDVIRVQSDELPRTLEVRVTGRGTADVLGALDR